MSVTPAELSHLKAMKEKTIRSRKLCEIYPVTRRTQLYRRAGESLHTLRTPQLELPSLSGVIRIAKFTSRGDA
jgi:hypothetical protein